MQLPILSSIALHTIVSSIANTGTTNAFGFHQAPLKSCFNPNNPLHKQTSLRVMQGGQGEYYGESGSSIMVKEINDYEALEEIVKLASLPLPERPDGIVSVIKFTSAERKDCISTEAEYERLARLHCDTIFLRCFAEYEDAEVFMGQAKVTTLPTFDVFYGGKRVGRVEGPEYTKVEELVERHGFINSKLDLFSEEAANREALAWGDRKKLDATRTPRTTARFVPGYDWDKNRGFFDELGDKMVADFESTYENWVPDVEDDKKKK